MEVLSGVNQQNYSLGSPITFLVRNEDFRPDDYKQFQNIPRPGHADYTYYKKYKILTESGGGKCKK